MYQYFRRKNLIYVQERQIIINTRSNLKFIDLYEYDNHLEIIKL